MTLVTDRINEWHSRELDRCQTPTAVAELETLSRLHFPEKSFFNLSFDGVAGCIGPLREIILENPRRKVEVYCLSRAARVELGLLELEELSSLNMSSRAWDFAVAIADKVLSKSIWQTTIKDAMTLLFDPNGGGVFEPSDQNAMTIDQQRYFFIMRPLRNVGPASLGEFLGTLVAEGLVAEQDARKLISRFVCDMYPLHEQRLLSGFERTYTS